MTRVIIPSYNFSRGNKAGSTAAKLDKAALAALLARFRVNCERTKNRRLGNRSSRAMIKRERKTFANEKRTRISCIEKLWILLLEALRLTTMGKDVTCIGFRWKVYIILKKQPIKATLRKPRHPRLRE